MTKRYITALLFICMSFSVNAQYCVGTDGVLTWEAWQGIYDDEFAELTATANYPTRPSITDNVYKLQTPINYDNYFGSRIRGFIHTDVATSATFNVTGNAKARFFLSTSSDPADAVMIANTESSVDLADHDEYPSQTSGIISLEANTYYYFEFLHVEGSSSDHATVYWKTDLVDADNWNIITANYLASLGCLPDQCPEIGTPCDDGDPSTSDDVEDGYCNCFGIATTSNSCVGERSKITSYRYDSIPSGYINELYDDPSFPSMPDYSENLNFFGSPSRSQAQEFGTTTQAFLSVPVSGNYKFNVTGDDNTVLFLSSDDTYENRQAHQALVTSWTYMTEHDKFIWQSTSNIYLEKGQFYYIEINHKEGGGSEHFSAFWQTPFTEPGVWKRMPSIYFHDYDCEIACMSEGASCDDGNAFTNNDMYNNECECVGTPCSGPDCDDPIANYVPIEKCNKTDMLDNRPDNNWLSCDITANPNTNRAAGHWIMYDLGERHELHTSRIWNYNVSGETNKGFENVVVDYSDDGTTWTEYNSYTWPLATGDSGYSGFSGPNFMGTYARYILISSLDDPATCRGLGKVTFKAVLCPLSGTECDDNNVYTIDDKYNDNCECLGQEIIENECDIDALTLGDSTIYTDVYSAETYVNSISQVASDNTVSFIGGQSVVLDVGFETGDNTLFIAAIDTCEQEEGRQSRPLTRQQLIEEIQSEIESFKKAGLTVTPLQAKEEQLIRFNLESPGAVRVTLQDEMGNVLYTLVDHEYRNPGLYTKRVATKRLEDGIYFVNLESASLTDVEALTVQRETE